MSTWIAEQQVYAAWTQAIFSAAAIGAGFAIMQVQRFLDRRELLAAAGRLVVEGMNLLDIHAQDASHEVAEMLRDGTDQFFGFENIRLAMEAIPVERLPSDIIARFATFANFMRQAEQRLRAIRAIEIDPQNPVGIGSVQRAKMVGENIEKVEGLERQLELLHATAFQDFKGIRDAFKHHRIDIQRWR